MCACQCIISTSLFQIVFGGPRYLAEYIVVEANCTDGICVPLNDPLAVSTEHISFVFPKNNTLCQRIKSCFFLYQEKGLCTASGVNTVHTVDCKMFSTLVKYYI